MENENVIEEANVAGETETGRKKDDSLELIETPGEGDYGWFNFRPKWLQFLNKPGGFLCFFSIFLLTQGMLLNGMFYVILSTLEKRFLLTSRESGSISAYYHLAYLIFGLFATFYGNRAHRPLMLSIGSAIFGGGCLLFALPHFTTPLYDYGQIEETNATIYCNGTLPENCESTTNESSVHDFLYLFYVAMFINGIGCVPLYTVSYTVIEDSLPTAKASLYNAIANSMTILGPTIGYLLGGYFLTIYVDFNVVGKPDDITIYDPEWVGAWWIGYLISTAILWIFVAVPLGGFTRRLPGTAKAMASRKSEIHATGTNERVEDSNFGKSIKDMPHAIWILLKNPPFCAGLFAGIFDAFAVTGFSVFLPKIIEHQFHQPAAIAAILTVWWCIWFVLIAIWFVQCILGIIAVPGGVFGILIAGVIVHRWDLNTKDCIKFCILCGVLVLILSPFSVLYCSETKVVGINQPYIENSTLQRDYNLTSICNRRCNCPIDKYRPVCSVYEEAVYFSTCHAACQGQIHYEGDDFYNMCTCVKEQPFWTYKGLCEWGCPYLVTYLILIFFIGMFNFMATTPNAILNMRSIPASQRAFAMGLNVFFYRIGSIPGPIVYGVVIDSTCIFWQQLSCNDSTGSCIIYDNSELAWNVLYLGISFKAASVFCYILGLIFYKPIYEVNEHKEIIEEYKLEENGKVEEQDTVPHSPNAQFTNLAFNDSINGTTMNQDTATTIL